MTSLDERLRDLPPERYARGARAAADLAIRAAELVGREPPADAIWLSSQTEEQLREQQRQRLDDEGEDRAQATRPTKKRRISGKYDLVDLSVPNGGLDDVVKVTDLDGFEVVKVTDIEDGAALHRRFVREFVLGISRDLHKRWESDPDGFGSAVRAEDAVEAGETMAQGTTQRGQIR